MRSDFGADVGTHFWDSGGLVFWYSPVGSVGHVSYHIILLEIPSLMCMCIYTIYILYEYMDDHVRQQVHHGQVPLDASKFLRPRAKATSSHPLYPGQHGLQQWLDGPG